MKVVLEQIVKACAQRRRVRDAAGDEVRLAVAVARDAEPRVAAALRQALTPLTATARLDVSALGGHGACGGLNALCDAAVVLCGADWQEGVRAHGLYGQAGVACGLLVPASQATAATEGLRRAGLPARDVMVCAPEDVAAAVGAWLVSALPDASGALAAGFSCCRQARARAAAFEAVRDNALTGLVPLFDGADLPVMLATEVAMMFKMADAYGLPLRGAGRLGEAGALVGTALCLRGIARACVARLPLPAGIVRAGVAAAGTYAVGCALMAYYEHIVGAAAPSGDGRPAEGGKAVPA